jgi:hypothetical protein
LRRGELTLVAGSAAALVVAAVVGLREGVGGAGTPVEDPRLSTYSTGPNGAKGLAETLHRLGLVMRPRRHALFDLAEDTVRADPRRLLAFLDINVPTAQEIAAVRGYVARGGRIFVAGYTGIEQCFAYRSRPVAWPRSGVDSIPIELPEPGWRAPRTRRVLWPVPPESLRAGAGGARGARGAGGAGGAGGAPADEDGTETCATVAPAALDTLLRARDGRPVALRLEFRGGGEAILLADARYLRNRSLKETDAGLVVVPWFLAGGTRSVTVDEYHQGYGDKSWLFSAAWHWLTSTPAGWAMLQLLGVGLVAVAVAAVRFGPPRRVIETRRRSPLEHLEALAAGLEGAAGVDTTVALTVSGLRRRLGRAGILRPDEQRSWLAGLELALPTPAGRNAARRLQGLVSQPGGPERALATAQAVEDVWEELRPRTRAAS